MKLRTLLLIIILLLQISSAHSQSGWLPMSVPNKSFVDINFVENQVGFIFSAGSGTILKTLNNGINWFTIEPTGVANITAGYFTTEGLGCILGNAIYKTTTGGWAPSGVSTPNNGIVQLAGVVYSTYDTGYACGVDFYPFPTPCCYDGVIWRTTDGGDNWLEVHRYGGSYNTDLFHADSKHLAVLNPDRIFYTSNAGVNWSIKTFPIFSEVIGWAFTNPYLDTIYIAGRDGGIIRTTNNGVNWTYSLAKSATGPLNEIFSVDLKRVYAVGNAGKIFYSSNSGNNWITQYSGTTKKLTSVWFVNKDSGFVTGDSGVVLKTYTGGLTSLTPLSNEIPDDFYLSQNYPNPFNSVTKIKFSLPSYTQVILKIHDINGREVEILANEYQKAGEYEIKWNAENLPSGIYFYSIQTKNLHVTRKMILLK